MCECNSIVRVSSLGALLPHKVYHGFCIQLLSHMHAQLHHGLLFIIPASLFTRRNSTNPPRTRPEAMRNYERDHTQSEVAALLRGEGDQRPTTPAKNLRHLKRSELW